MKRVGRNLPSRQPSSVHGVDRCSSNGFIACSNWCMYRRPGNRSAYGVCTIPVISPRPATVMAARQMRFKYTSQISRYWVFYYPLGGSDVFTGILDLIAIGSWSLCPPSIGGYCRYGACQPNQREACILLIPGVRFNTLFDHFVGPLNRPLHRK